MFDYGFEINKKNVYCIRKKRGIIGLFEIFFNRRCTFLVRANTYCYGHYITKKDWRQVEEIFPDGYRSMKVRCLNDYVDNYKIPLNERKDFYISYYEHRKDFH